ncbi:unnamed protein product [Lasius platythorax]|uniref:Uncharacterized protein n=1 Tax=Lasius platythorax TaxID=488582 RepID=A0AAV2NVA3_9HYME
MISKIRKKGLRVDASESPVISGSLEMSEHPKSLRIPSEDASYRNPPLALDYRKGEDIYLLCGEELSRERTFPHFLYVALCLSLSLSSANSQEAVSKQKQVGRGSER